MPHGGIEVDRGPLLQHDRIVKFGVDDHAALQDVDILLAGVADEVAELLRALGADLGDDRDHPLAAQLGAQVVIVVVGRLHPHRPLDRPQAAARGHRRRADAVGLGEQLRHPQSEPLAELLQLVVGQRQPIVLDLRQGRDRDAALRAHLLERPPLPATKPAQQRTKRRGGGGQIGGSFGG